MADDELDDLVAEVRRRSRQDSDLERLSAAVALGEELTRRADALVGHFVEAAKRAGCSWAEIGGALGVSRQAAQQRERARRTRGSGSRPRRPALDTEAMRQLLDGAAAEAVALGHTWLGTEHLLLALLVDEGGEAARALRAAGVDAQGVRDEVVRVIGSPPPAGVGGSTDGTPRMTPRTQVVLELAGRKARKRGGGQVRGEHVLLALLAEGEGLATQVLFDLGVDLRALRRQVQASLVG